MTLLRKMYINKKNIIIMPNMKFLIELITMDTYIEQP